MKSEILSVLFEKCAYEEELENIARLTLATSIDEEETVKKIIKKVYSSPTAEEVISDIVADNVEETQYSIKPLDVFMVVLLDSSNYTASAKPIWGTDVSSGMVSQSEFYLKTKTVTTVSTSGQTNIQVRVAYSNIVLFILNFLYINEAPQLTNCFLQVLEATFNCVARHKEVFEYLIVTFMIVSQSGTPEGVVSNSELSRVFRMWIDVYKKQALFASIINPMLFLFKNCYSVYENLESHGVSFWSSVIETVLDIPMPFEMIPDLDKGWTWSAYSLNESNPLVKKAVTLCLSCVNTNWKVATSGISSPSIRWGGVSSEYLSSMKVRNNYSSLPSLLSAMKRQTLTQMEFDEFTPPLRRFLYLCSAEKVQEAFFLYLINCSTEYSELSSYSMSSMLETDSDGNIIAIPTQEFLKHLKSLGIDLETSENTSTLLQEVENTTSVSFIDYYLRSIY